MVTTPLNQAMTLQFTFCSACLDSIKMQHNCHGEILKPVVLRKQKFCLFVMSPNKHSLCLQFPIIFLTLQHLLIKAKFGVCSYSTTFVPSNFYV